MIRNRLPYKSACPKSRLLSSLVILSLVKFILANDANLLKGKTKDETTHPYQTVALDPDSQHIPLDSSKSHLRPPRPRLPAPINQTTIFMGTVSFRDARRCAYTLLTAMQRAKYPERVTLGVVDQVFEDDERCIDVYCQLAKKVWPTNKGDCPYRSQIRIDERDAGKSRGPSYARHYRQLLIKKEEFCMQVDAHSQFTRDWDVAMIEDWIATENEMGILTVYPHDINSNNLGENGENRPPIFLPHLCDIKVGGFDFPRIERATLVLNVTKPIMTALWGGGLVFGKCHSEKRVKVDSHTQWMFDGEEYMRSALLWMSGYDLYSPSGKGNAIYHNYTAVPSKYFQLEVKPSIRAKEEQKGANRMRLHLGQSFDGRVTTKNLKKYGGSHIRHLDQYLNFSGVMDINNSSSWQHRCYQQHWVPYEHPQEIEKLLPGWKQEEYVNDPSKQKELIVGVDLVEERYPPLAFFLQNIGVCALVVFSMTRKRKKTPGTSSKTKM